MKETRPATNARPMVSSIGFSNLLELLLDAYKSERESISLTIAHSSSLSPLYNTAFPSPQKDHPANAERLPNKMKTGQ
jgi:hypothetical protein